MKTYVKHILSMVPNPKTIVKFASSPGVVAVAKVAIAVITLCQAIDGFGDSQRKIGFRK